MMPASGGSGASGGDLTRGAVLRALIIAGEGATAGMLLFSVRRELIAPGWHEAGRTALALNAHRAVDAWDRQLPSVERARWILAITRHLEDLQALGVIRQRPAAVAGSADIAFESTP